MSLAKADCGDSSFLPNKRYSGQVLRHIRNSLVRFVDLDNWKIALTQTRTLSFFRFIFVHSLFVRSVWLLLLMCALAIKDDCHDNQ